jgi:hypothetical protein
MLVQVFFVEHDQVIQALPADGYNYPFYVCTLPRRTRRRQHLFNTHRLHLLYKFVAEDLISVPQQIAWCAVPGECLSQLLSGPFRRRMGRDGEVDNAPPLMCQHQKYIEDLESDRRHHEKVTDIMLFRRFSRKVCLVCDGGLRLRTRYLPTLVAPISMPSLSNSPGMRGATQSGFSRLIVRINSRTCLGTLGRPGFPRRLFQVQNKRKPLRCQPTTVEACMMKTPDFQSCQTVHSHAHKRRSAGVSLGRFTERCRTPI